MHNQLIQFFKSKRSKINIALLAVSMIATISAPASADDFNLRVSDDVIHANLSLDVEQNELSYGGGYLYKDDDDSVSVINLDLHSTGQTAMGNYPTTVSVGIQANYLDADEAEASALGLGGAVRVNLPDTPGVSVESELHFAPGVLSFQDAERFTRFRLQANYRIIRTADVSAGYRYLSTKLDNDETETIESGLFVGLKLNF